MGGSPISQSGVESSKKRLNEAMQALRANALANTADESKLKTKPDELEAVARFIAFLDASEYTFDEIQQLSRNGNKAQALQALSKYSEKEIDAKFQPLLDKAIEDELNIAKNAKFETESLIDQLRIISLLASLTAAVFCVTTLIWLLRSIKKPLTALMRGTAEIADGNLIYRIPVMGRDEFGYLAAQFNEMAEKLGVQHAKLRDSRAVLERRVAERTLELVRLNEELEVMDGQRRAFLADISHELRTPITILCGEAEVTLRTHELSLREYRDTLQRILELAMQLGKYVNDLLYVARADSTNLQFESERLDFNELIKTTTEDFQVMAAENSITVSLNTLDQPLWINGDKQRLRQLLFILGDNACRYSKPEGLIQLDLSKTGQQAQLSIEDQGIGIPAEDLERIFERQFRSQNAQLSRNDGSGLGLPLAKSILKAHGGEIYVTSIENVGSTFTIKLPLIETQEFFENER
jgi:two-component system, OmpR family, sensor kinase